MSDLAMPATTEFADPGAPGPHVHRNYKKRPILVPAEDVKLGNHKCKICDTYVKGITYQRVTTFIDILEDRYGLEIWAQRGIVQGIVSRDDILTKAYAAASQPDEKERNDALDEVIELAREAAGQSERRELGTAVHSLCELINKGQEPIIPPTLRPDIDAYRKAMEPFEILDTELFVVNDELRVAGTTDLRVSYKGRPVIADIKTGKSLDLSGNKYAMQKGVYARSKRYNVETQERSDLNVDLDYAAIIHLPAGEGRAEIVWCDIRAAWDVGISKVRDAWAWRKTTGIVGIEPPGDMPDVAGLISMCGNVTSLYAIYEQFQNIWTDELTELARAKRAELERAV